MGKGLIKELRGLISKTIRDTLLKTIGNNTADRVPKIDILSNARIIRDIDIINVYLFIESELQKILSQEFYKALEVNEITKTTDTSLVSQKTSIENKMLNRRIGWLLSKEKFKIFWDLLKQYSLVDCQYKVFKEHFFGTGVFTDKIIWYETDNRLTFFIYYLMDNKVIPVHDKPFVLISSHFRSINKEYDPKSLRKNNFKGVAESRFDQFNHLLKEIKIQLELP